MEFLMFVFNIVIVVLVGSWLFHLIEKYIEGRKPRETYELSPHLVEWLEILKKDEENK